ncbi:hypothetical protein ACX0HA_09045 [Flavobacterium hauense]
MDSPTTITVWFPGELAVVYHDHTLAMVVKDQLSLEANYPIGFRPLLLEFKDTGSKIFYNSGSLEWYLSGKLSFDEIIENLGCEGLYRNKVPLKTQLNAEIEPECLWMKRDDILRLIDDDEMILIDFNVSEKLFYKVV